MRKRDETGVKVGKCVSESTLPQCFSPHDVGRYRSRAGVCARVGAAGVTPETPPQCFSTPVRSSPNVPESDMKPSRWARVRSRAMVRDGRGLVAWRVAGATLDAGLEVALDADRGAWFASVAHGGAMVGAWSPCPLEAVALACGRALDVRV